MAEITLRGQTITVEQKLVTEECCACHVLFAMTSDFKAQMRRSRQTFYCPNGHGQSYTGKTTEQRLQEALEEERRKRQAADQRVAEWQDYEREARQRAEHERNRANGYKGHATKITKRAKAGVCPCCNRTFKQLAQHMANKHPQFTPIEIDQVPKNATVQ